MPLNTGMLWMAGKQTGMKKNVLIWKWFKRLILLVNTLIMGKQENNNQQQDKWI